MTKTEILVGCLAVFMVLVLGAIYLWARLFLLVLQSLWNYVGSFLFSPEEKVDQIQPIRGVPFPRLQATREERVRMFGKIDAERN
jgi:hypothetical protein